MIDDAELQRLAAVHRTVLKDEPEALVEVLGVGPAAVVRKVYRNRGLRLWQSFGRQSRARREFDNLVHVAAVGAPCTPPRGWSATTRLGCVVESALITGHLPDSRTLKAVLADLPATTAGRERRALCAATGRLLAAMHRGGLVWCTPMPRNVLVLGDPALARVAVCDTPLLLVLGRDVHGGALAAIDLYAGAFSPSRRRDFSATERLRWLLGYCDGDRRTARRLWRAVARRSMLRHDLLRALSVFWHVYLKAPLRAHTARRTAT